MYSKKWGFIFGVGTLIVEFLLFISAHICQQISSKESCSYIIFPVKYLGDFFVNSLGIWSYIIFMLLFVIIFSLIGYFFGKRN